ncbi:hypothetical protein COMNV_01241 [Commensalibacter sp. Nvir]|uniref:hypothetical protein n=1 Tax=Commensalibacter sp. Nvir TaxID=3069817 RepID=UPI002D57E79E|nr:hypothetical protein COMNV_01241 [Commensalibacter sp. Nvir]
MNVEDLSNKSVVPHDLLKKAAYLTRSTPVVCKLISQLMQGLKIELEKEKVYEGSIEDFLCQLQYLLYALEQDSNQLHHKILEAGYKYLLYYQN